jgi:phage tail-like protein
MPDRLDPYAGYNFSVELDGLTRAGFRSCSGLDSTTNASSYREGTDRTLGSRKIPGLLSHGDVTLSRGVTADDKLWKWREKVMTGQVERHNISITLLNDVGDAKITWNLYECWPTQWTGPSFDATSDEVAVEQLVLTYERIEVDSWR